MKFLADVNVSQHIVARLPDAGFDIVRVPEIMDGRAADVSAIEEAGRRGAVVISHDQDFTAILAVAGATRPSLINLRVSYVDNGRIARLIEAATAAAEGDPAGGAIVSG